MHAAEDVEALLAGLDELPVEEHVAVLQAAHDHLSGLLSGASGPAPAADQSRG